MTKTPLPNQTNDLSRAIKKLKNAKEIQRFFQDLLTAKEIKEINERWQIAKMLNQNKRYIDIEKISGKSSRTIARVSKCFNQGRGGFKLILKRIKKQGHLR